MTREEVIKILKEEIAICKYNLYDSPRSDYLGQADRNIYHSRIKAFEMAIQALEDIYKISKALSEITNSECSDYGYTEECDLADKYVEDEE